MFLHPTIEEVVKRYQIKFHGVQAPFATGRFAAAAAAAPTAVNSAPPGCGAVRDNSTQLNSINENRNTGQGARTRTRETRRHGDTGTQRHGSTHRDTQTRKRTPKRTRSTHTHTHAQAPSASECAATSDPDPSLTGDAGRLVPSEGP